ncbi:hypothetical protein I317_04246 [Kwoniella heveanensis CBS 569]|nr:hypothetical protein I317_04246 [Kwoniella heveanensis CBS 569]
MSSSASASASASSAYQPSTKQTKNKSSYSDVPSNSSYHPHSQHHYQYPTPGYGYPARASELYGYDYDHDLDYDYPASKESYPPSDRPALHSPGGRDQNSASASTNAARYGELQMHHIHLPNDSRERLGGTSRSTMERTWAQIKEKSLCACSCSGEGGLGKGMMIGWIVTTVIVLAVLAWWRGELFEALDDLSKQLASMGHEGKAIIFILILITTIPPVPLYSTLIVLSGYTFGVWDGFVVSYAASLVGAVLVFVVSRCWLKDVITKSLANSPTSISILNILPSNPHLLLLIRIAPYPYNLLNVILASSPTLTLRTYTGCTAISLCKLVLHTWIGAGIHDLSASYGHNSGGTDGSKSVLENQGGDAESSDGEEIDGPWPPPPFPPSSHHPSHGYSHHVHTHSHVHGHPAMESSREDVKVYSTWIGIILCVGLFFYLTHLAKRALKKAQEEQEDREREMRQGGGAGGDGSGVGLLSGRNSEEV